MSLEEMFSNLPDEQKEQVKACTSPEEMKQVFEDGGMKLDLDDLEAAAGGRAYGCDRCITVTIWDT